MSSPTFVGYRSEPQRLNDKADSPVKRPFFEFASKQVHIPQGFEISLFAPRGFLRERQGCSWWALCLCGERLQKP